MRRRTSWLHVATMMDVHAFPLVLADFGMVLSPEAVDDSVSNR
jgi:hypothetical protein